MTDVQEKKLVEAYERLDQVCGKLLMQFGAEATAHMLVVLAKKYADIFGAQVRRLDLENQRHWRTGKIGQA